MRVYLLGIAAPGMGSFRASCARPDHEVSGSDEKRLPAMSDKLAEWKIRVLTPSRGPSEAAGTSTLAVVGNVLRADNVEAKAARRRGVPQMSFPEALEERFSRPGIRWSCRYPRQDDSTALLAQY